MKKEELMGVGLPKWPQMIVTGTDISEEQALEIIRRTDAFFEYQRGNNKRFIEKATDILKMPKRPRDFGDDYDKYYDDMEDWRKKWGYIETDYIRNDWISSCYVGGPHGWCHPNGTIGYSDNIGKYPSVSEVYSDWQKVAAEFPFLEIEVTLMNGEHSDFFTKPAVSMLIRDGKVNLVDPKERNIHEEFDRTKYPVQGTILSFRGECIGADWENGISLSQIRKWADQVFEE